MEFSSHEKYIEQLLHHHMSFGRVSRKSSTLLQK